MRQILAGILLLMCVVMLGAVAAADNQMGIRDSYKVTFTHPVRVSDSLLPKGDYKILHVMEGSNHIMVFEQLGAKTPIEVRVKCTLVPLGEKAGRDEKVYTVNAQNEFVLQELVFKGDLAKHVF